jgi:hypothetical protein
MIFASESSVTGDDDQSESQKLRLSEKVQQKKKEESVSEDLNKAIVSMSNIRQDTLKIANEIERANKIEEMKIRIEIARQIGDNDMLQEILQSQQSRNY